MYNQIAEGIQKDNKTHTEPYKGTDGKRLRSVAPAVRLDERIIGSTRGGVKFGGVSGRGSGVL